MWNPTHLFDTYSHHDKKDMENIQQSCTTRLFCPCFMLIFTTGYRFLKRQQYIFNVYNFEIFY
jgi:hypothetical protein